MARLPPMDWDHASGACSCPGETCVFDPEVPPCDGCGGPVRLEPPDDFRVANATNSDRVCIDSDDYESTCTENGLGEEPVSEGK